MNRIDAVRLASNETLSRRYSALKLIEILASRDQTMSVVDGCAGYILDLLTIPGATKAFRMGVVASNWQSKVEHGTHSLEKAKQLALQSLSFHNDDIGLAAVDEFVAIAQKNQGVWGTRVLFPQSEKKVPHQHQFILAQSALSLAYMYLRGHISHETHAYRLPSSTYISKELINPIQVSKIHRISDLLNQTNQKIATMESCTGGALASAFESAGTDVIDTAWITYDEEAKVKLGVPIEAMAYGTVYSERVALAMAQAIQKRTGAEIGLATTGTMDTADTRKYHTDTKPGTVFCAICINGREPITMRLELVLDTRERMKAMVVNRMIDELLAALSRQQVVLEPHAYMGSPVELGTQYFLHLMK